MVTSHLNGSEQHLLLKAYHMLFEQRLIDFEIIVSQKESFHGNSSSLMPPLSQKKKPRQKVEAPSLIHSIQHFFKAVDCFFQ
jgi:hypothetical protein